MDPIVDLHLSICTMQGKYAFSPFVQPALINNRYYSPRRSIEGGPGGDFTEYQKTIMRNKLYEMVDEVFAHRKYTKECSFGCKRCSTAENRRRPKYGSVAISITSGESRSQ